MSQRKEIKTCFRARRERGYALLLVLFFVALMIIGTTAAAPNLLTQGRREKEDEMIWRGEQYARGVSLYFHKNGRYPQSLDDLLKAPQGIHFMRKAYKDPMNGADGAWRLIYVSPSGQLIGSVRYTSLAQMAASQAAPGTQIPGMPVGALSGNPSGATSNTFGSTGGGTTNPISQNQAGGNPSSGDSEENSSAGGAPGNQPAQGQAGGLPAAGQQPQPIQAGFGSATGGQVFGGNLIGVGSTVEKRSLKRYKGGKTYRQWEFIWNPLSQLAVGGQQGAPGQPVGGPGQPASGQQPILNPGGAPNPNPQQ